MNPTELKAFVLPCCGNEWVQGKYLPHPVCWNPGNEVIQCHNCGRIYTPNTPDPLVGELQATIDRITTDIDYVGGVQFWIKKHDQLFNKAIEVAQDNVRLELLVGELVEFVRLYDQKDWPAGTMSTLDALAKQLLSKIEKGGG